MNDNSAEPAERLLTVPETEEEPSITNISAQFQTLNKRNLLLQKNQRLLWEKHPDASLADQLSKQEGERLEELQRQSISELFSPGCYQRKGMKDLVAGLG